MGKAAYFITLSPYFVLTALLAYAATRDVSVIIINTITTTIIIIIIIIALSISGTITITIFGVVQGAGEGILEFLTPKWADFENYDVRKSQDDNDEDDNHYDVKRACQIIICLS